MYVHTGQSSSRLVMHLCIFEISGVVTQKKAAKELWNSANRLQLPYIPIVIQNWNRWVSGTGHFAVDCPIYVVICHGDTRHDTALLCPCRTVRRSIQPTIMTLSPQLVQTGPQCACVPLTAAADILPSMSCTRRDADDSDAPQKLVIRQSRPPLQSTLKPVQKSDSSLCWWIRAPLTFYVRLKCLKGTTSVMIGWRACHCIHLAGGRHGYILVESTWETCTFM